jgi:hypothetical protein
MRKFILACLMSLPLLVTAQCTNVDFSLGNFTNWQASTGNCCPIVVNPSAVTGNRHVITSGPATDPRTCNQVPVVCPWGGPFSARLGNWQRGAQAEGLSYTFTPTITSSLFIYSYAVVFEDPGHTEEDQPRFESFVIAGGDTIECTKYQVFADSNLPNFQSCPGIDAQGNQIQIMYRNWSQVGVDLTAFIGQPVTIYFRTGDCALSGHYGYAYVDAIGCQAMDIDVLYCVGDTLATLNAPSGFESYVWSTGDTGIQITVDPSLYNLVSCTITSITGCVAIINTTLNPIDPHVAFSVPNGCFCDTPQNSFTDLSTSAHSPIVQWYWTFGDGGTSNLQNPNHYYSSPGTYTVTLEVTTAFGCHDLISTNVQIFPCPSTPPISHN